MFDLLSGFKLSFNDDVPEFIRKVKKTPLSMGESYTSQIDRLSYSSSAAYGEMAP
jgi:hypothetical protein